MKMVATLALVAGTLGLSAPAAFAASLGPAPAPETASRSVTPICGCDRDANLSAGFYSGFADSDDYDSRYVSGFYDTRYRDGFEADPPPYAFFPDRYRVYRMWGWRRGGVDGRD